MRIAVAYESGNVFAHFGRTGQFKIYEIENGQVTATRVVGLSLIHILQLPEEAVHQSE